MQPHFPGYPIYMLAAFGMQALVDNPFLALSLLSALAAALVVWPLMRVVERISGPQVASWTALLWAVAPLSLVAGAQPLSDSFGTLFATGLAWAALVASDPLRTARSRALALLASGVLLGLLLGVRVSYLPFALLPMVAAWQFRRLGGLWSDLCSAVAAAVLTSLLWAYVLMLNVGSWFGLWQLGLAFTGGHFSDWGGAYTAGSVWERLLQWLGRQWGAAGIGTPWTEQQGLASYAVLLLVALAGIGFVKKWRGFSSFVVVWLVPYFLWALFAQNVEKPRHLLPLLPLLLWALVVGLTSWPRASRVLVPALAAAMLVVGLGQVAGQGKQPAATAQLADHLAARADAAELLVFTYEEERVIRYLHPEVRTLRLRQFADLRTELLNRPTLPQVVLTDSVLNGLDHQGVRAFVEETARFRGSPWLDPVYHDITLYEVPPAKRAAFERFLKRESGGDGVSGVSDYVSGSS